MDVTQKSLEELYMSVRTNVKPIALIEKTAVDGARLDPERGAAVCRDLKAASIKNAYRSFDRSFVRPFGFFLGGEIT